MSNFFKIVKRARWWHVLSPASTTFRRVTTEGQGERRLRHARKYSVCESPDLSPTVMVGIGSGSKS